jgi:hypothetical protein
MTLLLAVVYQRLGGQQATLKYWKEQTALAGSQGRTTAVADPRERFVGLAAVLY